MPIPELNFYNWDQKQFEFLIATNKEILVHKLPTLKGPNPFLPHRIQFYSLLFILEGEGQHYIDFKSYEYKRGSIIFISRDQVHRFEYNDERNAYFIVFTKEFLEQGGIGSNLMQRLTLYNYHLYPPVLQLTEPQIDFFQSLVQKIKEEYDAEDDELTQEIIQSYLKIFLSRAERIRKTYRAAQKPTKYQLEFIEFQRLLEENQLSNRQVKFYADTMNISTKKLNRIIQEVMQQSAKSYIDEIAIIEMKRLLMNTSLSIKEIAFQTGFDEPTNFVKFFKKQAGITPIGFRKQYRRLDES